MKEYIKSFLLKSLWVVIVLLFIRCLISMPKTIYEFFGCASQVISITVIIMFLYEKILWRYNPFEKIPKLEKEYDGKIEYNYNGKNRKKLINIYIKQTLLTISIRFKTDEISSNSINANFIFENNQYVLYYTYMTNPKNKVANDNPIQYGNCRLIFYDNNNLYGIYWTSRQTTGDIILQKKLKI